MEPGPVLAGYLASIDIATLSGYARVVVMRAHSRMVSHYQAHLYSDMAAVVDALDESDGLEDLELVIESAAAEIRAALRLTRRAADSELALAMDLRERLPRVWDLLCSGDLDIRRAKTISYGTSHLGQETARVVVEQVIEGAAGLTTGQLAAQIRRLCIEVDPDSAKERFEHAVEGRRLMMEPTTEGTAHLGGFDLSPDRAAAATAHINKIAQSLRTSAEVRTIDQLRADVFLDLLCGTGTHSVGGNGGV
ncbi:MAG: 13E12 repeat family protein, partial [Acidimicrobiia bacterium]|nr:13E12 repeat family protein [Acidimicrobiia bacterium]